MSGGFGWSLNDVVLLATTTSRVVHALKTTDGASSEYQRAKRSLESLQATLEEIKSILSTSESAFRSAISTELDDSTSSIAAFNTRILQRYETALGSGSSQGVRHGVWRKLKWEFDAAKEFAEFQVELSRQLEKVKLLMAMQLWKLMSTVTIATSESHEILVSGLNEFRSQNTKTLDTIQEVRNGLLPVLKEVHSLRLVNRKRPPELTEETGCAPTKKRPQTSCLANGNTELRASGVGVGSNSRVLSRATRDRALTLESSRKLRRETSRSQHALVQALLNVENVIMDVKDQQDRNGRRTCSEQAEQFLQIQQGMQEIKGLFQTVRDEMHSTNAQAYSTLSLRPLSTSVQRGYASLSNEIKQLITFIRLALRNFYMLLVYLVPQTVYFLRALHRLFMNPSGMPSGDLIRFQDILGNIRYFNSAHFCHFEVFEAFLRKDFIGKPGESRILEQQYHIIDARRQGAVITKANWQTEVGAGANLVMSLVIEGELEDLELCPLCREVFGVSNCTESKHCMMCDRSYHSQSLGHIWTAFESNAQVTCIDDLEKESSNAQQKKASKYQGQQQDLDHGGEDESISFQNVHV